MTSEDPVVKKARVGDADAHAPSAPSAVSAPASIPITKSSAVLVPASEVVAFHLLTSSDAEGLEKEIESGGASFSGEFFHQHFNVEGREEQIKGYVGLNVDIWLSARTMHMWLDIRYKTRKPGADKLDKIFGEFAPPGGFIRSKEDFINIVCAQAGSMPALGSLGTPVSSLSVGEGQSDVEIIRYTLSKCDPVVKGVHGRMESLMTFFIDGASAVDDEDEMWELLLAVKEVKGGGSLVLGMQTVYKFWAFPNSHRLRLSQVLVLPPYQGIGIGKKFLQVAYAMAAEMGCRDLTVEDPSPNLQCVREKLECEMMLSVPWIVNLVQKSARDAMSGSSMSKGSSPVRLPPSQAALITKELKITRKEVTLVWECLVYCQAGLVESKPGMEALEKLISGRLEAAHFAHNASDAEAKQVLPLGGKGNFIMCKWAKGKENVESAGGSASHPNGAEPSGVPKASAAPMDEMKDGSSIGAMIANAMVAELRKGGEDGTGGASDSGAEGTVATGRLNVTTVTAEEKSARMAELLKERLAGLATLKSLMQKRCTI